MLRYIARNVASKQCHNLQRYCKSGKEIISCRGIKYYKRFPDEENPHWEKTKLFMVQRVKPYKGNPYWEKKILDDLGLAEKPSDVAIVKNIPEMNAMLWKIKHLIRITPITFPNGEPSEEDIGATYLKENGELIVSKRLEIDRKQLEATEAFANNESKMDGKTLKKQLRYQWLNPRFNPVN